MSNVTKRLVMDAEEKIDRAMTRRKAWEAEQRRIYTFQPRVNDTSRAIVANSGAGDKTFLKRQDIHADRAAAREKRLKKKAMLKTNVHLNQKLEMQLQFCSTQGHSVYRRAS